MRGIYVGLGANLGDPAQQVLAATAALSSLPQSRLLRRSRLYRTRPWGVTGQPDFVNAVAELESALAPPSLVEALLELERALGRERAGARWSARAIDLDLLVHGELALDQPGCHVPHPRLAERAFALVPLHELEPELEVPGAGTVADLLLRLAPVDRAGVVPLEPPVRNGE